MYANKNNLKVATFGVPYRCFKNTLSIKLNCWCILCRKNKLQPAYQWRNTSEGL